VVQYAFENYAVQRNLCLSLATRTWIFLDADERLTTDLKKRRNHPNHQKTPFLPIIFTATSCSKHEIIR
jgi:hypothetical protein